jgi:hypothetical protein
VRGGARFRSLSHALNHAGRHKHHAPGLQRKAAAGAATYDASARDIGVRVNPEGVTASAPGERSEELPTPLDATARASHGRPIQTLQAVDGSSWSALVRAQGF